MDLKILICVESIFCMQGMRLGKHDGLSHLTFAYNHWIAHGSKSLKI